MVLRQEISELQQTASIMRERGMRSGNLEADLAELRQSEFDLVAERNQLRKQLGIRPSMRETIAKLKGKGKKGGKSGAMAKKMLMKILGTKGKGKKGRRSSTGSIKGKGKGRSSVSRRSSGIKGGKGKGPKGRSSISGKGKGQKGQKGRSSISKGKGKGQKGRSSKGKGKGRVSSASAATQQPARRSTITWEAPTVIIPSASTEAGGDWNGASSNWWGTTDWGTTPATGTTNDWTTTQSHGSATGATTWGETDWQSTTWNETARPSDHSEATSGAWWSNPQVWNADAERDWWATAAGDGEVGATGDAGTTGDNAGPGDNTSLQDIARLSTGTAPEPWVADLENLLERDASPLATEAAEQAAARGIAAANTQARDPRLTEVEVGSPLNLGSPGNLDPRATLVSVDLPEMNLMVSGNDEPDGPDGPEPRKSALKRNSKLSLLLPSADIPPLDDDSNSHSEFKSAEAALNARLNALKSRVTMLTSQIGDDSQIEGKEPTSTAQKGLKAAGKQVLKEAAGLETGGKKTVQLTLPLGDSSTASPSFTSPVNNESAAPSQSSQKSSGSKELRRQQSLQFLSNPTPRNSQGGGKQASPAFTTMTTASASAATTAEETPAARKSRFQNQISHLVKNTKDTFLNEDDKKQFDKLGRIRLLAEIFDELEAEDGLGLGGEGANAFSGRELTEGLVRKLFGRDTAGDECPVRRFLQGATVPAPRDVFVGGLRPPTRFEDQTHSLRNDVNGKGEPMGRVVRLGTGRKDGEAGARGDGSDGNANGPDGECVVLIGNGGGNIIGNTDIVRKSSGRVVAIAKAKVRPSKATAETRRSKATAETAETKARPTKAAKLTPFPETHAEARMLAQQHAGVLPVGGNINGEDSSAPVPFIVEQGTMASNAEQGMQIKPSTESLLRNRLLTPRTLVVPSHGTSGAAAAKTAKTAALQAETSAVEAKAAVLNEATIAAARATGAAKTAERKEQMTPARSQLEQQGLCRINKGGVGYQGTGHATEFCSGWNPPPFWVPGRVTDHAAACQIGGAVNPNAVSGPNDLLFQSRLPDPLQPPATSTISATTLRPQPLPAPASRGIRRAPRSSANVSLQEPGVNRRFARPVVWEDVLEAEAEASFNTQNTGLRQELRVIARRSVPRKSIPRRSMTGVSSFGDITDTITDTISTISDSGDQFFRKKNRKVYIVLLFFLLGLRALQRRDLCQLHHGLSILTGVLEKIKDLRFSKDRLINFRLYLIEKLCIEENTLSKP